MISLKKYLDSAEAGSEAYCEPVENDILSAAMAAYGSALLEMGSCSLDACPGLGDELKRNLSELNTSLSTAMSCGALSDTDRHVQEELRGWGRRTARHYKEKSDEVKELLIVMAHTAESVGARDERCAGQINDVTARLKAIASLEDLTEIRASIENSAAELKTSVQRMTAEGRAAVERLREQVSTYQAKLEEAEAIAYRDALTGLRSRLCVESQIERRIGTGGSFCVAIVDIDGFKKVNDDHGHLTGDEVLKQFATELKSACRSTDVIGRWGGDEFIILLDCGLAEASAQTDRLRKWVCGDYTVRGKIGAKRLRVDASIGLAENMPDETMKDLLARADAAMYARKAASRSAGSRLQG
jgi:diguanylate cyclase (GGDEF)-like protein